MHMDRDEMKDLLEEFEDGTGFGDPDARRNAELRLQVLPVQKQQKTASRLNLLTFFLVIVGLLQVVVLTFQLSGK
jgi:hypothetical protein